MLASEILLSTTKLARNLYRALPLEVPDYIRPPKYVASGTCNKVIGYARPTSYISLHPIPHRSVTTLALIPHPQQDRKPNVHKVNDMNIRFVDMFSM